MNQGGWTCPHDKQGMCERIKRECDPGDKGCVLYGKAKFASQESPSNEAFEKRIEQKMRQMLHKKPDKK